MPYGGSSDLMRGAVSSPCLLGRGIKQWNRQSLEKGKTAPLRILPSYLHRPMDGAGALNWCREDGQG